MMAIPQLVNPGEGAMKTCCRRSSNLPGPSDFPPGNHRPALGMKPAASHRPPGAVSAAADSGRLVSSAKSWLSYSGVDRTRPPAALPRSRRRGADLPLEATRRYLAYLRHAWGCQMPAAPFAAQQALVTVPLPSTPWPASSPSKPPNKPARKYHSARRAPAAFYALGGASHRLAPATSP